MTAWGDVARGPNDLDPHLIVLRASCCLSSTDVKTDSETLHVCFYKLLLLFKYLPSLFAALFYLRHFYFCDKLIDRHDTDKSIHLIKDL